MALRHAAFWSATALAMLATGCGDDAATADGELSVATTVSPITSIVAQIGGDRVKVAGIVPEGTNSHTFEPRPSVAELLSSVDVLFVNGLGLEEPTRKLAESTMRSGAEIVELAPRAIAKRDYVYDDSFPRSGGKPNPHLWTDPRYALRYARAVRDVLARRDPPHTAYYDANLDRFRDEVARLDTAMRASFASIPRARRRLLTYHDAYAYFAQDYGWDVIGAIQVSDFDDPTPKDVAALIDQVRRTKVPAIFGSEVFPSPVLRQIGAEAHVRYVDVLRDDDLPGEPGEPAHSWQGLLRFDYLTITEAMGGDAGPLRAYRPRTVAPERAEYPR